MSKPPSTYQIDVRDLEANPSRIFDTLNTHMREVRVALDHGLSIEENLVAQFNEIVLYIADGATPYPFSFAWHFPQARPRSCKIGFMESTDGVESVFTGVDPWWGYNDGNIVIKGLRGNITINKTYRITFETKG